MNLGQCINHVTLRIDPDRAIPVRPPFARLPMLADPVPEIVQTDLPAPGTQLRRIYDYLRRHPAGASNRAVSKATSIGHTVMGGYLDKLRSRGLVTSTGERPRLVWRAAIKKIGEHK